MTGIVARDARPASVDVGGLKDRDAAPGANHRSPRSGRVSVSAGATATTGSLLLATPVAFAVVAVSFLAAALWVHHDSATAVRAASSLLLIIGVLRITGLWDNVTIGTRSWVSGYEVVL